MFIIISIICLNSAGFAEDDYGGHFWVSGWTCVVFILLQLNVTDRDFTQATHTEDPSSWIPSKSLSKPSCLWGKHTDYCIQLSSPGSFPFCPERVPFQSHTAAICRCHWSCSFPADHSFSSDGSCGFMFWMIEDGHCETEATMEFTFLIQDAHLIWWFFWSPSASTDDFRGRRERAD